jgi:hypothetical protein
LYAKSSFLLDSGSARRSCRAAGADARAPTSTQSTGQQQFRRRGRAYP